MSPQFKAYMLLILHVNPSMLASSNPWSALWAFIIPSVAHFLPGHCTLSYTLAPAMPMHSSLLRQRLLLFLLISSWASDILRQSSHQQGSDYQQRQQSKYHQVRRKLKCPTQTYSPRQRNEHKRGVDSVKLKMSYDG